MLSFSFPQINITSRDLRISHSVNEYLDPLVYYVVQTGKQFGRAQSARNVVDYIRADKTCQ
jgi:hypothetical protein